MTLKLKIKKVVIGIATLITFFVTPSVSAAPILFNFFWTGDPLLDSTIISSPDPTLQAIGTMEINAAPGATFALADIVSTSITVSGASFADFTFSSWTFAGGTISGDGLSATFSATSSPLFNGFPSPNNFGCDSVDCRDGRFRGGRTNLVVKYSNTADLLDAIKITAVPVPAATWLFGSGLLGLIGVARRKKV